MLAAKPRYSVIQHGTIPSQSGSIPTTTTAPRPLHSLLLFHSYTNSPSHQAAYQVTYWAEMSSNANISLSCPPLKMCTHQATDA